MVIERNNDSLGAHLDVVDQRVVDAARRFGSVQADAAEAWVQLAKVYAVAGKVPSGEALLQQEVGLFTDCLLDGDADKCKELDSALRELLELLETQGNGDFIIRSATSVKLKVVAARVCTAAECSDNSLATRTLLPQCRTSTKSLASTGTPRQTTSKRLTASARSRRILIMVAMQSSTLRCRRRETHSLIPICGVSTT